MKPHEKTDPDLGNYLGNASFVVAVIAGLGTGLAWGLYFPFTLDEIRRIMAFTFLTSGVAVLLGLVGLFRSPRGLAFAGIAISVLVAVGLWVNVG